jgi:hypothetical protein
MATDTDQDGHPVLTADQWGKLRQLVNDAGYPNVIEGLSRELARREAGEVRANDAKRYGATAAQLRKAANTYRDVYA